MMGSIKMFKLDLYTMKSQMFSYLYVILITMFFTFMKSSIILVCITCSWFMLLMSTSIFAIQERNNLNRLYGSLSIKLKNIVLGRYIFIFITYIITVWVIIILFCGILLLQGKPIIGQEILIGFSISLLVFSFVAGIQIPAFFKLGYTKAKFWTLVPYLGFIVWMIFSTLLKDATTIVPLSNQTIIILVGILLSVVFTVISYRVSIIAYRKRK